MVRRLLCSRHFVHFSVDRFRGANLLPSTPPSRLQSPLHSVTSNLIDRISSSRTYSHSSSKNYDLFGSGKPGDEKNFRKAWKKEMEEDDSVWTGSEDESDSGNGRNSLEEEVRKAKQKAKAKSDLIDADDSDE